MEPGVIFDTVFCKVVLHCLNVLRECKVNECLSALFLACADELIAVNIGKFLCAYFDVLTVVAVLGELDGILTLENLLIADVE